MWCRTPPSTVTTLPPQNNAKNYFNELVKFTTIAKQAHYFISGLIEFRMAKFDDMISNATITNYNTKYMPRTDGKKVCRANEPDLRHRFLLMCSEFFGPPSL